MTRAWGAEHRICAWDHITRLGEEHDLQIRLGPRWHSQAHRNFVQVPSRMTTGLDYFLALHEFGHHLAPGGRDEGITAEAVAWQWAWDNALPSLHAAVTKADYTEIGRAFVSHLQD